MDGVVIATVVVLVLPGCRPALGLVAMLYWIQYCAIAGGLPPPRVWE